MKPISVLTKLFFFLLLVVQAQGQSLYQDAKALVEATRMLEEKGYDLQDSAAMEAYSRMIAILYEYDNPMSPEFSHSKLAKLPYRYMDNPRIPDLIPLDSLTIALDSTHLDFIRTFREQSDSLRQAPRERMVGLLRGEYGSSPAEYLSVSRALREYSIPPVETQVALAEMAQESNQNVHNGLVNSQAIIEGLFQFVLERAQEEVVINFMERFLTKDVVEYEDLFPTVVEQFRDPGQTYSNSFIQRVRDAFYEDLQMLSVRLPSIILSEERFDVLKEDPLIYNLLAVYSIVGMAQNGLPLEEILPLTFRNLYENYYQTEKKANFLTAETPTDSPEYQELVRLSRECVNLITDIYLELEDGEAQIMNGIEETTEEEGISYPDFALELQPAYNLDMLFGTDTAEVFRLNLLPYLLEGRLDTAYILRFRNVGAYDRYFGEDRSPEEWRAAGLDLVRNLNGTWFSDLSIDQILSNWTNDLTTFKMVYDQWKMDLQPNTIEAVYQNLEVRRQSLQKTILATKDFWEPQLTGNQGLAFDMLAAIIDDGYQDIVDFLVGVQGLDLSEAQLQALGMRTISPEAETQKLIDVEDRLYLLNDKLASQFPEQQSDSPVQQYLSGKESAHPYAGVLDMIDLLSKDLEAMGHQLDTVKQVSAPSEMRIMANAQPMLGLTETLTHLMYCLRSGSSEPGQKWITKAELDTLFNNPALNNAYLGLLYQRLCQVQHVRRISPEGLARLVQLTVGDLPYLLNPTVVDTLNENGQLNFYYTSAFIVNTLNRVLDIPLIVDPATPDQVYPLSETDPTLDSLAELSNMVLDLIYYLNIGDHRHAMTAAIRLFILMEGLNPDGSIHEFLSKYGYFIADLVDAETGDEVQSLLEGIADPPGSSRLKRQKKLTVGLNAYLGGSVGRETWDGSTLSATDQFISIAPTMPIGITMSGRIGNGLKPPSFSLFLSLLDLGSILSYRSDDSPFGDYKFTYKNMFKPSLQIHWNIPDSPFYIGVGGQIGRQYIENPLGDEINLRSTRFFFNFGVDVPIKTLFTK